MVKPLPNDWGHLVIRLLYGPGHPTYDEIYATAFIQWANRRYNPDVPRPKGRARTSQKRFKANQMDDAIRWALKELEPQTP